MNTSNPIPPPAPQSDPSQTNPNANADHFVPALIVIDMQNDFVNGSLAIPGAESIIRPVNDAIDLPWKIKIATRDFHPDNHVSFARTHQKPVFSKATIFHPEDAAKKNGIEHTLWPIHCVAYTGGADFVKDLNSDAFDVVVHKGTHAHIESYSAFKDVWGKDSSEFPDIVAASGATDIFIVGLAGDYCVKYTAIDAVDLGYRTWLITDGIKSIASEELVYKEMVARGIKLTTLEEVRKRFAADKIN